MKKIKSEVFPEDVSGELAKQENIQKSRAILNVIMGEELLDSFLALSPENQDAIVNIVLNNPKAKDAYSDIDARNEVIADVTRQVEGMKSFENFAKTVNLKLRPAIHGK